MIEIVQLSNGNFIVSDEICQTLVTNCVCANEDWKTQTAKGYGSIPANTKVVVDGITKNYYGIFVNVLYKGNKYSIAPCNLRYEKD